MNLATWTRLLLTRNDEFVYKEKLLSEYKTSCFSSPSGLHWSIQAFCQNLGPWGFQFHTYEADVKFDAQMDQNVLGASIHPRSLTKEKMLIE